MISEKTLTHFLSLVPMGCKPEDFNRILNGFLSYWRDENLQTGPFLEAFFEKYPETKPKGVSTYSELHPEWTIFHFKSFDPFVISHLLEVATSRSRPFSEKNGFSHVSRGRLLVKLDEINEPMEDKDEDLPFSDVGSDFAEYVYFDSEEPGRGGDQRREISFFFPKQNQYEQILRAVWNQDLATQNLKITLDLSSGKIVKLVFE